MSKEDGGVDALSLLENVWCLLQGAEQPEQVAGDVLEAVGKALGTDVGAIWLRGDGGLVPLASHGFSEPFLSEVQSMDPRTCPWIASPDQPQDSQGVRGRDVPPLLKREGIQCCAWAPLPSRQAGLPGRSAGLPGETAPLGSILVGRRKAGLLSSQALSVLTAVCRQMAIALEHSRTVHSLQAQQAVIRRISHAALWAEETERQRIYKILHDGLGQSLGAIGVSLTLATAHMPSGHDALRTEMEQATRLVGQAIEDFRSLVKDIWPPMLHPGGLGSAIDWLVRQFRIQSGLDVSFYAPSLEEIPARIAIHLYRVLQEALTNVRRHAQADGVKIALYEKGGCLILSIRDNGTGFLQEKCRGGLGLVGMAERVRALGGEFRLKTRPGRGTRIRVEVPVGDSL